MQTLIMKCIEIDAAHRIPDHHSKCKNIHGHRYKIEAYCQGELASEGAQKGMVGGLDFSFLKEEMVKVIDEPCDHGLILCVHDPLIIEWVMHSKEGALNTIKRDGYLLSRGGSIGKIYVIEEPPTAECLAAHWYNLLVPKILDRSSHRARLEYIRVWETPTCFAQYPFLTTLQI